MDHLIDKFIIEIDKGIKFSTENIKDSENSYPAKDIQNPELSEKEKNHSAGLMRVNQAGEICAQALYRGQSFTARLESTREQMERAADEELDHLAWCNRRLDELGEASSKLNPFWYGISFSLGAVAGLIGDKWSLGFIDETEKQVVAHLERHKENISSKDIKSKVIIERMKKDEEAHSLEAKKAGAIELPDEIKRVMALFSRIMTNTSYHI